MRGLFVTGTDTGAGKTVVAAAICAALAARGLRVAAHKPALTGLDEPAEPGWPRDDELLAAACGGVQAGPVAPLRYGPAVSPHFAQELADAPEELAPMSVRARAAAAGCDALVVEGVGGLLVPLCAQGSVRDLAAMLGLPLVIAARPGLGTISHTLLTVEAARAAGLQVAGIVMTPWPAAPDPIHTSNRQTVERLAGVRVSGLAPVASGDPALLAAAGAGLPLDAWLADEPVRTGS